MSNPFQQLKQQFQAFGTQLTPELLDSAQRSLQEWLDVHHARVAARKPSAEFKGKPNTTFYDLTGHIADPIQTNEYGWGEFRCNGGSVSVWIERDPALTVLSRSQIS